MSFLKGSVIVDGIVYTSKKPDNMEQSATEFEQQITAKNSQIGGNDVDPRSISLDGAIFTFQESISEFRRLKSKNWALSLPVT